MNTFHFMESVFSLFFILILGFILLTIFRGIKEWSNNNKQPVLSVAAKNVANDASK